MARSSRPAAKARSEPERPSRFSRRIPRRPAIRRATAASLFGQDAFSGSRDALGRALQDPDPLVRSGALESARALEPSERVALVAPLLRDPILTIRIDAARSLAAVPKESMRPQERADFEAALAEYERSLAIDADRAEAHLALAELAIDLGDLPRAEREYRIAQELVPALAGTYANLADLYRRQGKEAEAEETLRRGLAAAPRRRRPPSRAGPLPRPAEADARGPRRARAGREGSPAAPALRLRLGDRPRLRRADRARDRGARSRRAEARRESRNPGSAGIVPRKGRPSANGRSRTPKSCGTCTGQSPTP